MGVNDALSEPFFPSRGLQQRNPLSPYLFLLCVEGFSTILNEAKRECQMLGVKIGRGDLAIIFFFFCR